MTEPPAGIPAEIAAAERDVLLATKFHVPRPRPGLVPRPRLAERLAEGLGQGVVLVCAPAGYGKTVLLAEWAQRRQRPTAWLSLDAADNDPVPHTLSASGAPPRRPVDDSHSNRQLAGDPAGISARWPGTGGHAASCVR